MDGLFFSGKMKKKLIFCLLFVLWTVVGVAQSDTLPVDPDLIRGKLANGLSYFIKQHPRPEGRVELRLVVRAGSLQEEQDQRGLAHFVEHMAFNGTRSFPKNELIDFLERSGTRFGADLNAYTTFGETVYRLQMRTDTTAPWQKGLEILWEWAHAVSFDSIEIEKERGVVISEWRNRLSPDQRLQQSYFPVLYRGSRYAKRLPIGDPQLIATAPSERIRAFYDTWYRPELMAVIAVGNVSPERVEKEIRRLFSQLPKTPSTPERLEYGLTQWEDRRGIRVLDPEVPFTRVRLTWQGRPISVKSTADYREQIKRGLFNKMMGARLYEFQQRQNPPFTFANSALSQSFGKRSAYTVSATTSADKALEGFSAVFRETMRVWQHGFTPEEFSRQKKEWRVAVEKKYLESEKTDASLVAAGLVRYFLEEGLFPGAAQAYKLDTTLLASISLAEINDLLPDMIASPDLTAIITGNQRDSTKLPKVDEIFGLVDSIKKINLEPIVEQRDERPLFSAELPLAPVAKKNRDSLLDVHWFTLANGIRVVAKPTTFKADEVRMESFRFGGHSRAPDSLYESARAAALLADLSGVGDFSAAELYKKLAGKSVSLTPYITELSEGFVGNSRPDDLETMLQLLWLYVEEPRFSPHALEVYLSRQENILENLNVNPYYYFADILNEIKYRGHPRRKAITGMDELRAIKLRDAQTFYQKRFQNLSGLTFVFVGNFDPSELERLARQYLGNLPTQEDVGGFQDIGARLLDQKIDSVIFRGQAPKAIVDLTYHGAFDYSPQHRYQFSSLLSVLRIRLREVLREDLGGVYGVRVSGFNTKRPYPYYRIGIRFTAAPEMADTLVTTTENVMKALQDSGPTADELKKVKAAQLQAREKAEKENSYWMAQLKYRFQEDLPLDGARTSTFRQRVARLSAPDIQEAAQRYFALDQPIKIVLMPESNRVPED